MIDATLSDLERLGAFDDAERTFQMTEEAFRVFYEETARPVWLYLARMTGDRRLADDLLQDTYYRFLRAGASFESDDHRRHYLFRIATNLVRDHRRRPRIDNASLGQCEDTTPSPSAPDPAERAARHIDLSRAMEQLKPRERSLLWLAYAQGCSHEEIAAALGVKTASMKALLHRARRRLLALLGTRPPGGRR
jgi:RNA polymerase sigma-70 factor (ECF subfamily)